MTQKEAILRAVRFEKPDYIPMTFHINDACWEAYPQDFLFEMMESHPFLFPEFKRPKALPYRPKYSLVAQKDHPFRDDFGCLWETTTDGITGTVTGHPLSDWAAFDTYQFPDPQRCTGIGPIDWEAEKHLIEERRQKGLINIAGLRHGHTFLQLCDIRGYENLIFDMVDEEPKLMELIAGLEEFNTGIIKKYLELGVDMMVYAEDLGMQYGPMLSPKQFNTYISPSYERLMKLSLDNGTPVHLHSDGDIRTLADTLIMDGVSVLNLQDLVNGIDWIKDNLKGKLCIELDIDRQKITAQGTPAQIDELIRTEVQTLGAKEGGLMMIYGLYPGIPHENVKALMDAMEKYAFLYA